MYTNTNKLVAAISLCIAGAVPGLSFGALIDRGGGLIYDDHLNITWLSNANYGAGSSYDNGTSTIDGRMTWQNAMDWAANLSYYDSVRDVIYDDWRLPTTLLSDASCETHYSDASYGYNCAGSEMGHLFYSVLGGVAGESIVTTHNADYNLFSNLLSNVYWSATEYMGYDTAFYFYMGGGSQNTHHKALNNYAWAVRDGDVAAVSSEVPVPAAAWLLGSGLLVLLGVARKRRNH